MQETKQIKKRVKMSKYNDVELSAAVALEGLFVINVGNLGPKLSNKQDGGNKAIKMRLVEDGRFVELELKNNLGKTVVELVPITFFRQITPIIK